MRLVAQGITTGTAIAGAFAAVLASLIGVLTYRTTFKGKQGDDLERLTGTLSQWSAATIKGLQEQLTVERQQAHAETMQAEQRCRVMVEQLRAEFETRLSIERSRAEWWKSRALGTPPPDSTPPPDAREGTR